jgi:hypothetical protein
MRVRVVLGASEPQFLTRVGMISETARGVRDHVHLNELFQVFAFPDTRIRLKRGMVLLLMYMANVSSSAQLASQKLDC